MKIFEIVISDESPFAFVKCFFLVSVANPKPDIFSSVLR